MKVYLVMQHLFDEVKLFEPVCLSQADADAMVARLRHEGTPDSADQPIEWRELEIDFRAAQVAVEHHTRDLKSKIDGLLEKVEALGRIAAERDLAQAMHSEASRQRDECAGQLLLLRSAIRKVHTAKVGESWWFQGDKLNAGEKAAVAAALEPATI